MAQKICLITGANSGIGKVTACELARQGMHIIMVCRNPTTGKAAQQEIIAQTKGKVDLLIADLASQESIVTLTHQVYQQYDHLDILINNAGLILDTLGYTPEGIERTFGINHVGTFLLTNLLLDLLAKGTEPRIITVSSDAHKWAKWDINDVLRPKKFESLRAYANSKLANILFANELAKHVKPLGITSNSLHPGVVKTGFGQGVAGSWFTNLFALARPFFLTPEQGAQTSIYLASSPEVAAVTGTYFDKKKPKTPSAEARSEVNARTLWEKSLEWTKLEERKRMLVGKK